MAQYHHIAALGSSFAAGPGIDPIIDQAAMRSGRNYPHLLAEQLGARLTDLTVSGATTATILGEPQITMDGTQFAPQIYGLPVDAYLVTVTAGGLGASALSAGHSLGTAEPWISGLQTDLHLIAGSFHPNGPGMRAVAGGIARHLLPEAER